MSYKYIITIPELRLILSYLQMPYLNGFDKITAYQEDDKEEAMMAMDSLEAHGLLTGINTESPLLNNDLMILLSVANRVVKRFTIDHADEPKPNRSVYYFEKDMILLFQHKEDVFSILWIPYIHIAIGGVSSILQPYLNQQTLPDLASRFRDYSEAFKYCADKYCHLQTVFLECDGNETEREIAYIFANDKTQYYIEEGSEGVHLSCPGKVDLVNTIGQHLVLLHGQALKEGGISV